jgi:hypothetical protein
MPQARASQKPLREAAKDWVYDLSDGMVFRVSDVYRFLAEHHRHLCEARGDAKYEPQYKNDARWAVHDAKGEREIAPTSRWGEYRRTRTPRSLAT